MRKLVLLVGLGVVGFAWGAGCSKAPTPTEAEIEKALTTSDAILDQLPTKGTVREMQDSRIKALAAFQEAFPPIDATERFLLKNLTYAKAETVREYLDRIEYYYPMDIRYGSILLDYKATASKAVDDSKNGWVIDFVRAHDKAVAEQRALRSSIESVAHKTRTRRYREALVELIAEIDSEISRLQKAPPQFQGAYIEQRILAEGGSVTTARKLHDEFQANEIAALSKYKGRRIFLSGKVAAIDADFRNQPAVRLRTSNQFMPVTVGGISVEEAATYTKGQDINLVCQNLQEVAGSVFCEAVAVEY